MTAEHRAQQMEEDEYDWDFESAERRPGIKRRSVVISVRLPQHDFEQIARQAELERIPISTFLRVAALEKAKGRIQQSVAYLNGWSAATFSTKAPLDHITTAEQPIDDSAIRPHTEV